MNLARIDFGEPFNEDKPCKNYEKDTRAQTLIEPSPNLHKELQPLSRLKYLQKYCPSSSSVSMCDHNGGVVTSEDGAIN